MRFFYLFTSAAATAVVSNAAVLPRWNNPPIRYSDHAPATSMVNIASESHPPILAIQGYSGTLVSLMRRTPQVESAGGDGSGSGPGSVPSPTSGSGSGSGSGPGPGPESESSTSSSSESGPDPDPRPRPIPSPRTKFRSDSGSGFDFESESELSPSPRVRSKSVSDLESESGLSPSPRTRSKSVSDLGSGSDFDFGSRPRTRSGPESGPESGPGPESESATQVGASSSSSFLTRIRNKFGGFFKTIQRSTQRLTYALKKLIRKHTGPSREVKAAGKAVGGALGPPLIEYFAKSQKGVESIRDWLKGMGPSLLNLIKQSLGKNRYDKAKGSLKMAFNDASNDVEQNLRHLKMFLYTIKHRGGTLSSFVETSHKNLLDVVSGYQKLLVLLEPYLGDDAKGKRAAELLSEAKELITSFTDTQQRRYNAIMEMLRRLPKDYRGDQSASNKPSVMQKVKTLFGKKSPQ
ncbi:hypothetical protein BASA50_000143 [Batrachochytrium salamandrivorans]|uniref:Uncharacterized protein n=1 Tax=Batrachochytrium salamandrivorans TaxID=1357716 RepID=A0ABQ8EUD1_9FUNG|nr:hypothetical protein BASA50_000143 [Batrachochytrium salamandrivorans]